MTIKAINPTHQKAVNKAVKLLIDYNNLNDLRNMCYDEFNEKLTARFDKQCAIAWDKFYDAMYDLPKREKDQIEKSSIY